MHAVHQRKRPFIIGAFALILSGQALLLPIIFVVLLLMPSTSPVTYNGVGTSIGEVRLQLLSALGIWFAFAAYVGPGLWKGNPIARHVAFATYAGLPLIFFAFHQAWKEIPWLLICCAVVGGYLYVKPNVREFFETYQAT
jgi:peptidoglycan/LPS O-acetylase OafA/YrhL